ncbi:MAG: CotH kinase family protein [Limisphaerales bacterium]
MSFSTTTKSWSAGPGSRVRVLVAALSGLLLLALLGTALGLQRTVPGAATVVRLDGEGLFNLTNVWKIHLTFTPDQWQALEPKGGGGGPGGPGGPGGFGPAMFIAPLFLNQGDANHDGKLSREEFSALGRKWFAAWDTNKTGKLDAGQIRAGLDATLGSAGGIGPGGPGGGAGGPSLQGANGRRNGMAGAMGIQYPQVHADLDFEGWRFQDVSVRYKGNNTYMMSRNQLKRPLKVALNHGFKGRRLGGVTTLNLHNNVNDPSGMNEPLSYRLFRDAGVPSGRTAYAQVYLTVPGQYTNHYVGLYSIVENVDKNYTRSRFSTKRGTLFKPVTRQVFEDMGDNWSDYTRAYAAHTPVFDHEAKRVIEFSKLVSHASDAEFAARLEEFLDLDEFARFMAVTVWLSNMDSILSMGQNFYVYLHPKTQQFQFLPWDFDHSFGQFPMAGSPDELERLSILKPWSGQVLFLERVFKVERFKRLYLARMKEFSATIFQPERIQRQVDELAPVLRPAVQEESAQLLARFDDIVAGKAIAGFGPGGPGGPGGGDSSFGGPDGGGPRFGGPGGGFGEAMKPIRTFVVARAQSVNDQLAGKSEGATLSRGGPGGPPGGRGGPGGPPGGGGPGGFGPGMFLAQAFTTALDVDKDGVVTQAEFTQGFLKWFDAWNTDHSGVLTEEQLRAGINKDLSPFRGGPPPGFGFGPPPDGFGPPDDPDDF